MNLKKFQKEVHALALEKGWYDPPKTDLEAIALMHSELSEASEELRQPLTWLYYVGPKPEGVFIELADCILRILDYAQSKDVDMSKMLKIKHEYNKTRPYRHGKKL